MTLPRLAVTSTLAVPFVLVERWPEYYGHATRYRVNGREATATQLSPDGRLSRFHFPDGSALDLLAEPLLDQLLDERERRAWFAEFGF